MSDVSSITLSRTTDSKIKTYSLDKYNLALNSAWNEDLLHKELFGLKSMEFEMYYLKFDSK
jgi:hypothetical protein